MWCVQSPATYGLQRGHTITLHCMLSSGARWTEGFKYDGAKLHSGGVERDGIAVVDQGSMSEVERVRLNHQREITGHSKSAWAVRLNHTTKTELFQSPRGALSAGQPSTPGNQAFHGTQLFPSPGSSFHSISSSCSGLESVSGHTHLGKSSGWVYKAVTVFIIWCGVPNRSLSSL